MTEFGDQDIKKATTIFYIFKNLEKRLNKQGHGRYGIFIWMKTIRLEMKNILDWIKGKLDIAKENICKFENTVIETIQK